jgi:hypothetical protein
MKASRFSIVTYLVFFLRPLYSGAVVSELEHKTHTTHSHTHPSAQAKTLELHIQRTEGLLSLWHKCARGRRFY